MSAASTLNSKVDIDQISDVFAFDSKGKNHTPIYEEYYRLPQRGSVNPFYRIWRLYVLNGILPSHDIDFFEETMSKSESTENAKEKTL